MSTPTWIAGRFDIDLRQPVVMGIVNVTPDSFSDGGQHGHTTAALRHAEKLLDEGAGILDLGAESTRPGATPVPLAEELDRLLPVLRVVKDWGVPVSIDTYKPETMQACLDEGADIINDVWALRHSPQVLGAPSAEQVVASHPRCGVCLMHMHGDPLTMQVHPMDDPVLPEVNRFLLDRLLHLGSLGVASARCVIDPGIGFGKTPFQNLQLLARQPQFHSLGVPLLAGWSRKSTLGHVTGHAHPADRVHASVAAALLAVQYGAAVVRVHDVQATRDALNLWQAVQQAA